MKKLLLLLFGLTLFIFATSVQARDVDSTSSSRGPKPSAVRPELHNGLKIKNGTNSASNSARCEAYAQVIQNRSDNMVRNAQNMLSVFVSIASRVEDFYANKLLPGGKTVPNYDTLVANIASNSASVNTALTKATTDASAFSCTNPDPKGQVKAFEQDMSSVRQALKNYRTSVRNLILGVLKAAGSGHEASSSASPSASPI